MQQTYQTAPPLQISSWLNTETPITLAALKGNIVVLEAFQMLCPGCVSHGLPQAARIAETFKKDNVVILGLHTVFEHHEAMTKTALKAFMHEYRISFPVGIDMPSTDAKIPIPQTMAAYHMRGTPTLILIDRTGMIRGHYFGHVDDMALGADITRLLNENDCAKKEQPLTDTQSESACTPEGCS